VLRFFASSEPAREIEKREKFADGKRKRKEKFASANIEGDQTEINICH
jgi:hypothetical protein